VSSVLDRSLVVLVVALAVVVTGIMAIAPPPSDRSKPWIVRTLLFPRRALMVQPQPSGARTAPATPPAAGSAAQLPSQSPAGTTSVTGAPPAPDGRPKRGPLVLVSPPTPVNSQDAAGPDAAKSAATASEATTSEGAPVAPATLQAAPHASGQSAGSSQRPGTARSTAPSSARYTVQVGALRDRANVDLLVAQLRQHGFEPVVTQDGVYRVHVGENLDRAAADALAATLQAAGFDTFVRTY
jgi:cell division septation protein DedD